MNKQLLEKAYQKYKQQFGKTPDEANCSSISVWNNHFVYAPDEKVLRAFFYEELILQYLIPLLGVIVVLPVVAGTCTYITDALAMINNTDVTKLTSLSIATPLLILLWSLYKLYRLNKIQNNQITLIEIKD